MKSEKKIQCHKCNKLFKEGGYHAHKAMHTREDNIERVKKVEDERDKIAEKYY